MEFIHSFDVAAPVNEVWRILLDFERIAPCVPGAQLTSVNGNEYSGSVKVRLGPITAQYRGTAELTEVIEAERRITVVAKARDTHGQGNVGATLVGRIEPKNGGSHVVIETDLQITGKVAQLGRGVMQEVSAKLLQQFVSNLNRDVLSANSPADDQPQPAADAGSAPSQTAPEPTSSPNRHSSAAEPRLIPSREAEPIDLISLGGAAVGRKLVVGGVALAALIVMLYIWWSTGSH